MTDRKANILRPSLTRSQGVRQDKTEDKIRLMILANEVKTLKDVPPKDEK